MTLAALLTLATTTHLTGVVLARFAPSMPRGLVMRAAAVKEF
jgi:hypothetical protein